MKVLEPWVTEDAKALRAVVRRFVENELLPLDAALESTRGAAHEEALVAVRAKAQQSGLWLMDIPEALGGQGLGMEGMCVVWEELYRSASVAPRGADIFGPNPGPILLATRGEQKKRYLDPVLAGAKRSCFAQTEEAAGGDPRGMSTTARRGTDGWLLRGGKRFITGAHRADFFQVIAKSVSETGEDLGFGCFLVDAHLDGVQVGRCEQTLDGERVWEITLDDVALAPDAIVGAPGEGFRFAQGWLVRGRLHQSAQALAQAGRALEMGAEYITQRVTFGRPLSERQGVTFPMVDAWTRLSAARGLLYRCARAADAGDDVRLEAAAVKVMSLECAQDALDWAVQVHGGLGLTESLPLMRWFLDVRSKRITEGAVEVMRHYIGRELLKGA
jgi:acyl-CoA dehydrogenase